MDEIKSIWDGWTNQCAGIRDDRHGGNCALGWVDRVIYGIDAYRFSQFVENDLVTNAAIIAAYERVAGWIRAHYSIPKHATYGAMGVIAYANNHLELTPEQFREIDRKTQVDEIAKNLLAAVVEETNAVETNATTPVV